MQKCNNFPVTGIGEDHIRTKQNSSGHPFESMFTIVKCRFTLDRQRLGRNGVERTRTKLWASFSSERVVADWNSIPDDMVTAPSVTCFEARLDTQWKNLQSVFDLVRVSMTHHACSSDCYRTENRSMTSIVADIQVQVQGR